MTSITPAQLKVSIFFAVLLWFASVIESNFYMIVLLPWAVFMAVTTWKQQNPNVALFEDKPEPAPEKTAPTPSPTGENNSQEEPRA